MKKFVLLGCAVLALVAGVAYYAVGENEVVKTSQGVSVEKTTTTGVENPETPFEALVREVKTHNEKTKTLYYTRHVSGVDVPLSTFNSRQLLRIRKLILDTGGNLKAGDSITGIELRFNPIGDRVTGYWCHVSWHQSDSTSWDRDFKVTDEYNEYETTMVCQRATSALKNISK